VLTLNKHLMILQVDEEQDMTKHHVE